MSKVSVDVTFLYEDTNFKLGRTGKKLFISFSPYPSLVKSKKKWIGICPVNEVVARALASYFEQMAEAYEKQRK